MEKVEVGGSGLFVTSEDPQIGFELKPHLDVGFQTLWIGSL